MRTYLASGPGRGLTTRDLRKVRRRLRPTIGHRLLAWIRRRARLYWCICGARWDGRGMPERFYVGHMGSGRMRQHYVCDHCDLAARQTIREMRDEEG